MSLISARHVGGCAAARAGGEQQERQQAIRARISGPRTRSSAGRRTRRLAQLVAGRRARCTRSRERCGSIDALDRADVDGHRRRAGTPASTIARATRIVGRRCAARVAAADAAPQRASRRRQHAPRDEYVLIGRSRALGGAPGRASPSELARAATDLRRCSRHRHAHGAAPIIAGEHIPALRRCTSREQACDDADDRHAGRDEEPQLEVPLRERAERALHARERRRSDRRRCITATAAWRADDLHL